MVAALIVGGCSIVGENMVLQSHIEHMVLQSHVEHMGQFPQNWHLVSKKPRLYIIPPFGSSEVRVCNQRSKLR